MTWRSGAKAVHNQLPSEDFVIVRLGRSYTPRDDVAPVGRLTRGVVTAVHSDQ